MTNQTANGVTCEQCGTVSRAGTRLCRHCWAALPGGPTAQADYTLSVEEDRERRGLNARSWVRIAATAAVVLVVAWMLYRTADGRLINRPGPLPAPTTTANAPAVPGAWPFANGGADGTRTTPAAAHLDGAEAWRTPLASPLAVPAVADADRVYLGLDDGTLRAYGTNTGDELWQFKVPGVLDAAPSVGDGRVYAGLRDSTVIALDAATGEQLWRIQVGTSVSASPLLLDGTIFALTNAELIGLDAETGRVLWRQPIRDKLATAVPVVRDAHIVIATFRRVTILDRETARELYHWEILGANGAIRSVAIDGDVLSMTAERGVFAIDVNQRRPWWEGVRRGWEFFHLIGLGPQSPWRPFLFSTRGAFTHFPVVAGDGVVYAADRDGPLRAFEARTGELRWTFVGPVSASVTLTASGLLVPTREGLALVDPASGAVTAERTLADMPRDVVVTAGGLYVIVDNAVSAIR